MSDVEAERIRAFVESGGVALADTPPGVFDELGRPRTNPPLSDLFTGWTPQEAQPASAEGSEAGASSETGPRAFLLNRSFGEEPAVDIRTAVEDVLGRAGCAPAFRIDSDTAFDGERFRYRFGEAELFAALTSPTRAGRAKYRIAIPESACVYDLWTGLEVRRPGRIAWRAAAGEVALFSALPYRVTEVHAVAPNTVRPGTRLNVAVEIRAEERAPGTHLVHVHAAAWRPHALLRQDACVRGGPGATYSAGADEPPGFYKVVVRDMLTGSCPSGRWRSPRLPGRVVDINSSRPALENVDSAVPVDSVDGDVRSGEPGCIGGGIPATDWKGAVHTGRTRNMREPRSQAQVSV